MTHSIWCSDKFRHDWMTFIGFIQSVANRLAFGYPRYEEKTGGPHKSHRYMTRIGLELRAYRKTGNREHLLNINSYSYLESQAPENPKFHWNDKVDSVTRGKV